MNPNTVLHNSLRRLAMPIGLLVAFLTGSVAQAQTDPTGTYRATGKTCTITIGKEGNKLMVSVFAWWGNQMQTHGTFEGSCQLKNGNCAVNLYPDYTGTPCQPTIAFGTSATLRATFADCSDLNVPPDFSGTYTKVTPLILGDFVVSADKSYFYDDRDEKTRRKGYVLRGDKLDVQVIYDATWGYAVFNNKKGQASSGYVKLSTLTAKL